MYVETPAALVAGATAVGSGEEIDTMQGDVQRGEGNCRIHVEVTAVTGTTPSMTTVVEGLINGTWRLLHTFTAFTAVGEQSAVIQACPRRIRIRRSAMSGTSPNFTYNTVAVRF